MGENPSYFKKEGTERRPVEQVSWEDCQKFLTKVNEHFPKLNLSLPREAQWEYACRAGTVGARYAEDLDSIAWYSSNSKDETHDVGCKAPNDWGLYDMLGNVWEWCDDKWSMSDEGTSASRVFRGGSWDDAARCARAAFRGAYHPGYRYHGRGFRCSSSGGSEEPERSVGAAAEQAETAQRSATSGGLKRSRSK